MAMVEGTYIDLARDARSRGQLIEYDGAMTVSDFEHALGRPIHFATCIYRRPNTKVRSGRESYGNLERQRSPL